MEALEVINGIKNYPNVAALKGINLTVHCGEFFGLLGPNGAGKTTLIQSIVGLSRLSSGSIKIFGLDAIHEHRAAKALIGYSPQEVNLDRYFSIEKTLQYQAGYFGAGRNEQKEIVAKLLDQFGLTEKAGVQFYKLSGGMQKRALIAKALVSKPKLLILDEPTAGVDVEQRHELWKYLRQLNEDGTTIILTTHYIDEAEALCERIGIINLGEIKELGSPQDLIQKYCENTVVITTNLPIQTDWLENIRDFQYTIDGVRAVAHGQKAGVMTQEILRCILKQPGLSVSDISVNKGSLEEVFIKIT